MEKLNVFVVKLDKVPFTNSLYKKAYNCFFLNKDGEYMKEPIILLSPAEEEKEVYIIYNFDDQKTTYVAAALYAFLHRDGKEKESITIQHESGLYQFYQGETKLEILAKLQNIDKVTLSRFF